jgi:acyl-CoA synthetase (AMP-forming)/AMP-acid ligase II
LLDTPDLITLHLGAIAAGAIAVAISSTASAAELAQILAIVRPAALVVDAEFAGVAAGAVAASSPNTSPAAIELQKKFGPVGSPKPCST